MTVGGMGFIPERNLMTMMMMMNTLYCVKPNKKKYNHHYINTAICDNSNSYLMIDPFSSVLEFVCLPWSEVCSARVTSLLLLLLLLLDDYIQYVLPGQWPMLYLPGLISQSSCPTNHAAPTNPAAPTNHAPCVSTLIDPGVEPR